MEFALDFACRLENSEEFLKSFCLIVSCILVAINSHSLPFDLLVTSSGTGSLYFRIYS